MALVQLHRYGLVISFSMSAVKEIEDAIAGLTVQDMESIRDWLDELIEEHLDVRDSHKAKHRNDPTPQLSRPPNSFIRPAVRSPSDASGGVASRTGTGPAQRAAKGSARSPTTTSSGAIAPPNRFCPARAGLITG